MSTLEHLTTAQLNGRPVTVHQAHRTAGVAAGPGAVTVSAPVDLTLDEVAAVLFAGWSVYPSSEALAELGDDDYVRELIADYVVGMGCMAIEIASCDTCEASAASADTAAVVAYLRQRAAAVFTPVQWAGCNEGEEASCAR